MDAPKELALQDIKRNVPINTVSTPILEIGFGDGQFMDQLYHSGYIVAGTEISELCVDKIDVLHVAFVTTNPVEEPGYKNIDVVCCFEVIEHIENVQQFVNNFPGKTLYLSTPNPNRWYHRLTGKYEKWDFLPNHLQRFSIPYIEHLLKNAGYQEVIVSTTKVQAHTILRSFFSRSTDSDNYDDVRSQGCWFTKLARICALPATIPFTFLLNLFGYEGSSYYVRATR